MVRIILNVFFYKIQVCLFVFTYLTETVRFAFSKSLLKFIMGETEVVMYEGDVSSFTEEIVKFILFLSNPFDIVSVSVVVSKEPILFLLYVRDSGNSALKKLYWFASTFGSFGFIENSSDLLFALKASKIGFTEA
jgi:hypothetical protein